MTDNFYVSEAGFAYEAVENSTCIGCAHDDDFHGCARSPMCTEHDRDDGRSVIWVLAKEQE